MRILRATAALVVVALAGAAVAAAVEGQQREDTERVTTVSGPLARDGKGFTLTGKELGVGPRWWRETAKVADYDGDGTVETVTVELAGLVGKQVSASAEAEGDELSVRTLEGKVLRAAGRPPWAGGPSRKCNAKAAKSKAAGKGHGPPPWAKAHGRKGC